MEAAVEAAVEAVVEAAADLALALAAMAPALALAPVLALAMALAPGQDQDQEEMAARVAPPLALPLLRADPMIARLWHLLLRLVLGLASAAPFHRLAVVLMITRASVVPPNKPVSPPCSYLACKLLVKLRFSQASSQKLPRYATVHPAAEGPLSRPLLVMQLAAEPP